MVVIAIIAVIVGLSTASYKGYTKDAKLTEMKSNIKVLESASEQYYMKTGDWPRLTDDYYTSDQLEAYAKRIYDITGEAPDLEVEGKYYKIDYTSLGKYTQVPKDKENYVLQNPLGSVLRLDGLTELGESQLIGGSEINKPIITHYPTTELYTTTTVKFTATTGVEPSYYEWQVDDGAITTEAPNGTFTKGNHTVKVRGVSNTGVKSSWATKTINVLDGKTEGLVNYWPLDSDNLLADSVGGVEFITQGTGKYETTHEGIYLDGNIQLRTPTNYKFNSKYTIVLQVKNLTNGGDHDGVIGTGRGQSGVGGSFSGIMLKNDYLWVLQGNGDTYNRQLTATPLLKDGSWHEIAYKYDGINTYAYLDGVLKTTSPGNSMKSSPLIVGGMENSPTNGAAKFYYTKGFFKEIKIYDRALTNIEIENLYSGQ